MEQNIKLHKNSLWPANVVITCKNMPDEHRIINSQEEMNRLLEEVKLYNSENEIKKRITSV